MPNLSASDVTLAMENLLDIVGQQSKARPAGVPNK